MFGKIVDKVKAKVGGIRRDTRNKKRIKDAQQRVEKKR
jgi:hypothetical protein